MSRQKSTPSPDAFEFQEWLKNNQIRLKQELQSDLEYLLADPSKVSSLSWKSKIFSKSIGGVLEWKPISSKFDLIEKRIVSLTANPPNRFFIEKEIKKNRGYGIATIEDLQNAPLEFCEDLFNRSRNTILLAYTSIGTVEALGILGIIGSSAASLVSAFSVASAVGLCYGIESKKEDTHQFAARVLLVAFSDTQEDKLEALDPKMKETQSAVLKFAYAKLGTLAGLPGLLSTLPGLGAVRGPLTNHELAVKILEAAHHLGRLVWARNHNLI